MPNPAVLTKDLSQPLPLPVESVKAAERVLASARLFRYQADPEKHPDLCEAALLERDFSRHLGSRYAVGINSCGAALFLALRSCGVKPGDKVLVNAFTLTPVPSCIVHAGAVPIFVETGPDLTIDFADFSKKARESGARYLLLSHMRGHVSKHLRDIADFCKQEGITMVEDCAHSLGGWFLPKLQVGTFGRVACFSFQTNKLLNGGEGGMITTNDPDVAGRCILFSGSYGLFGRGHLPECRPPMELIQSMHNDIPNFSMRMTNLCAAVVRPQVAMIDSRVETYRKNWMIIAERLHSDASNYVRVLPRAGCSVSVDSSLQIEVLTECYDEIDKIVSLCGQRGLNLAWFGREGWLGFTSNFRHWEYSRHKGARSDLPMTTSALRRLCDLPLYHTLEWSEKDFDVMGRIISEVCEEVLGEKNRAKL